MTTNEELQSLASQLKNPSGEKGIEIADMMNETNIGMTKHAISCLNILPGDTILELGHGNCGHLDYLLQQNSGLKYFGLEMSELMKKEAQKINKVFIKEEQALFYLYDGLHIPFPDHFFDKIFTVNTVYFWAEPEKLLKDLYRVSKPGGKICITFAQESFMKLLPFTQFGFELYSIEKIEQLIASTSFHITGIEKQSENVNTKMGEMVERPFVSVVLGI